MYKTGRQRYEKGGGAIFYPTEIEIKMESENNQENSPLKRKSGRHKTKENNKDKKIVAGEGFKTVKVVLSKALMCDVKSLYKLFSEYSNAGEMLPRSMSDIYTHLRDFYIAEIECENESENENLIGVGSEKVASGCEPEVIGACALAIVWENLAEIRSLAVKKPYTRKLIGTELIKKCIEEAKFFKITNIFALTYKPQFCLHNITKKIDKRRQ